MQKFFYDEVDATWGLKPLPESCAPVFLIASVWRTGSTLTQRLIVSSKDILMWGEPFADSSIIQNLHATTKPFLDAQTRFAWPHFTPTRMNIEKDKWLEGMAIQWIANMYPDIAELKNSYRSMLDRLFFASAKKENFNRFGIKFVRLTVEQVQFLQWIYPDARIVFLTRNPYDAWNSYSGCNWTYSYPNIKVSKIVPFIKIWEKNTTDFLGFQHPNSMFFRYEDVVNSSDIREKLRSHCLLESIDEDILQVQQRGIQNPEILKGISPRDIQQIEKLVGPLTKKLGYLGHKRTLSYEEVSFLHQN